MKKIYKAHILYTKERSRFEVLENGYVAVGADGRVTGVAADVASLADEDAEVVDFGDRLLIPAMNDLHVHAAQYRNQGISAGDRKSQNQKELKNYKIEGLKN